MQIHKLFIFCSFLSFAVVNAQDSLQVSVDTLRLSENELEAGKNYIIDTIIDGQTFYKKEIKLAEELDENKEFEDHEHAAKIDEKWLEELYSNSLYDTIYRTVSELDYKDVYYPELTTEVLKERLAKLNARTPFNVEYNPSLESVIKSFLKNRRKSFEKLMGISHYYFPMFERELDNYNIPLEMKYLAIVESALKPRARSRVGATGLWQFMFATGKQYGLDVSSYVDERSDPIKSTEAASKYLSRLYEIFGDWDLALAAYNSGPGNVSKAIRRSGGYQNYWNIRHNLPRETAGYVPAFLATMYIFEFAEEHGFKPLKPEFQYIETDTIHVKQMITLDQVSESVGVEVETLQFLNPSYKLDIIPYIEGKNYTLRLPRHAVGKFVTNEKAIYALAKAELDEREKPLPQFFNSESKTRYTVRSGDYLGKIARKYGVRVSQLKQWNGLRSNDLRIGQRLTIYPRNTAARTASASKPKVNTPIPANAKTYTVRSGDSLWSISQKYPGVSVQNIRDWNDISGNNLKPGMKLIVSKG
ncbi:LysM peptidoglycan-binding domain-containing protein [Oceanihabitans sediminis]|uniref:LysM peptidoglycan-binding domain-containing protein n=1 Tax=Oceanihabitans sediminis TaxID=1812012 RepID=A0A368P7R9_9FLAO|nr:LysM peptidoglycan-binding domain-containing protein [Oceanihabitans sediminis]MDX1279200.1 LysM peptidoglycan-binding domain-containing protein [Oceanihabitans sediminis]MDX1772995.1 LysM peptidoglycan-binding domain-containing protein [Oceanihabitans sediminis]RBP34687.1 membrane-bound lytic murein transglycosylase D [Oceanihabitans sediminis]RCU58340.1 LysM peptidoglycan-binding domain-containing protein [Oceanihabitans sediminis]